MASIHTETFPILSSLPRLLPCGWSQSQQYLQKVVLSSRNSARWGPERDRVRLRSHMISNVTLNNWLLYHLSAPVMKLGHTLETGQTLFPDCPESHIPPVLYHGATNRAQSMNDLPHRFSHPHLWLEFSPQSDDQWEHTTLLKSPTTKYSS